MNFENFFVILPIHKNHNILFKMTIYQQKMAIFGVKALKWTKLKTGYNM